MFYSQYLLGKKGELAKVWMAAHWDRKLNKQQIFNTDVVRSVAAILAQELQSDPEIKIPLALRLSGHLLLGVARIHSKQIHYLYADCSDALAKMRSAFREGDVNLPEAHAIAKESAITLKPNHEPLGFDLRDLDVDFDEFSVEPLAPLNLARPDEITLADSSYIDEGEKRALEALEQNIPEFQELPMGGAEWKVEITRAGELGMSGAHAMDLSGTGFESELGGPSLEPQEIRLSMMDQPADSVDLFAAATPRPMLNLSDVSAPELNEIEREEMEERGKSDASLLPRKRKIMLKQDDKTQIPKPKSDYSRLLRDVDYSPARKKSYHDNVVRHMEPQQLFALPCVEGVAPEIARLFGQAVGAIDDSHMSSSGAPDAEGRMRGATPAGAQKDGGPAALNSPMPFSPDPNLMDYTPGMDVSTPLHLGGASTPLRSNQSLSVPMEIDPAEEPVLASRVAKEFHGYLSNTFDDLGDPLSFLELMDGRSKLTVAGSFMQLLSFHTKDLVHLEQTQPYGDIAISKTQSFEI